MKKAFTVAEGLVTLVIVGVLASVTIASVVKEKPNKNKVMIRSSFAELSIAMNQLVGDSHLYPDFAVFGLQDGTQTTVRYAGHEFNLSDNRGKMCVGLRHYLNAITQDYIDDNVSNWTPCRASFYTKSGALARFEVNTANAALSDFGNNNSDYKRFIIIDVNPAENGEVTKGELIDTIKIRIHRSGKLEIVNSDAAEIVKNAEIK